VDLSPFGMDPVIVLFVYGTVLIVAILGYHAYHAVRDLKTGATSSDLFAHDPELGREPDGHWRREQLRRFGALPPRHHHGKRHLMIR
jgi:hypothetical protein